MSKLKGFGLIVLVVILGLTSCKTQSNMGSNEVGQIIEDLPCEGQGRSDKNFFRASAMATSTDLSLAKEKALLNAKQRLVTLINSNTKTVTDRYVNEREFGDASEFEQKFENLTREVANETIRNIVVTCEKASVLPNGKYRGFIAIEVSKEELVNGISNKLSQDKKLQVDYDKEKFEEIFNKEMEKIDKEQN